MTPGNWSQDEGPLGKGLFPRKGGHHCCSKTPWLPTFTLSSQNQLLQLQSLQQIQRYRHQLAPQREIFRASSLQSLKRAFPSPATAQHSSFEFLTSLWSDSSVS